MEVTARQCDRKEPHVEHVYDWIHPADNVVQWTGEDPDPQTTLTFRRSRCPGKPWSATW